MLAIILGFFVACVFMAVVDFLVWRERRWKK